MSAEREELRTMVRALLAKESSSDRVRELFDDPTAFDKMLWDRLVEVGVTGIDVPAESGGAGGGFTDVGVVLVELGRSLTVSPFFASGVLGTGGLLLGGTVEQRATWLPQLASGTVLVTAAITGSAGELGAGELGLTARPADGGTRIDGVVGFVPDVASADLVLLAAAQPDGGVLLALVETGREGLYTVSTPTVDPTRKLGHMRAEGVLVGPASVLTTGEKGAVTLSALTDRAVVALACDSLGIAEAVLALTVAYVKDRVQFGRPIGSFQAVKHRCAEMLVAVETSRVIVNDAVAAIAHSPFNASSAASAAKAYAADAAAKVAGDGIQLHGGIGYTWEHDLHVYLKRAKLNQALFGPAREHRRRVADLTIEK